MREVKLEYDNGSVSKTITCFVPESWDEVTWKQFTELQQILRDEELSSIDKAIARTAVVTRLKVAELEQCDFQQALALMESLTFLQTLDDPDLDKAQQVITINGQRYHAVQLHTMADLTAYDKIETAEGLSFEEKASLKMAVFLRAELPPLPRKWWQFAGKKNLELEEFNWEEPHRSKRSRLFSETLSVQQVSNLTAFFLKAAVASQIPSLSFGNLDSMLLRQNAKMEQLFGRVMAGNQPSGRFQKILWKMKRYYSFQSARYLLAWNTTK